MLLAATPISTAKRLPEARQGKRSARPALPPLWVRLSLAFAAIGFAFAGARLLQKVRFDDSSSGWSALWLGDVDADGVPDLALGIGSEPSALRGEGRVRILSGATGATLSDLRGVSLANPLSDVVGPVRDLNGPGRPGIWWKSGDDDLRVSADGLGPTGTRIEVEPGGRPYDLGDVDGDGAPDLLIPGFPRARGLDTISAVSTRTLEAIWTLSEPATKGSTDRFARKSCAVGDVDGDGAADVAIVDAHKRVRIVCGRSGALLRELEQRVGNTGILAPLGDVDGDGRPELALHEGWNPFDAGYDESKQPVLSVVSCAGGSVLRAFDTGRIVWEAGSPGDLDGDGIDDRLVTRNVVVPRRSEPPVDLWRQGRIEILSGRDGSLLRTFDGSVLPPRDD